MHRRTLRFLFLFIFITLLIFQLNSSSHAKDLTSSGIRVSSSVNKKTISIGEQLRYRIRIYTKPNTYFKIEPLNEKLGIFDIDDIRTDAKKGFNENVTTVDFILLSYDTGEQVIPKVKIEYGSKGILINETYTKGIRINVRSVFETSKIEADIKPIEESIPLTFPYKVQVFLMVLAFLTAIFIAIYFLKKHIQNLKKASLGPPSYIKLYIKLSSLVDSLSRGPTIEKDDFLKAAALLKGYLEAGFNLKEHLTTEEFLKSLKSQEYIYNRYGESISNILREADLIKFANADPDKNIYTENIITIKEILAFMKTKHQGS